RGNPMFPVHRCRRRTRGCAGREYHRTGCAGWPRPTAAIPPPRISNPMRVRIRPSQLLLPLVYPRHAYAHGPLGSPILARWPETCHSPSLTGAMRQADEFGEHARLAEALLAALGPEGDDGSHDRAHLLRVWRNARLIAADEPGCDRTILVAAVILHD